MFSTKQTSFLVFCFRSILIGAEGEREGWQAYHKHSHQEHDVTFTELLDMSQTRAQQVFNTNDIPSEKEKTSVNTSVLHQRSTLRCLNP